MNYKMVFNEISNSIETNSVDKLSDSLNQAYINCPRSAKYKSAICFGYQYLAKRISDPAKVIQSLDRARLMFPSDKELLEDELNFLEKFIESHKNELCDEDYGLINAIIQIIQIRIPGSSFKIIKQDWNIFLAKFDYYKQHSAGNGKSKLYRIAEPMLFNLFSDLSQKDRDEMIATLINETIIDIKKLEEEDKRRKKLKDEFTDSP